MKYCLRSITCIGPFFPNIISHQLQQLKGLSRCLYFVEISCCGFFFSTTCIIMAQNTELSHIYYCNLTVSEGGTYIPDVNI